MTGSLSVVASTVDSVLDLLAGLVIWTTMRMVRQRDPVQYPQGKTRLEPLGVIIFSCIMSVSMMSLMQESVGVLVRRVGGDDAAGAAAEQGASLRRWGEGGEVV